MSNGVHVGVGCDQHIGDRGFGGREFDVAAAIAHRLEHRLLGVFGEVLLGEDVGPVVDDELVPTHHAPSLLISPTVRVLITRRRWVELCRSVS